MFELMVEDTFDAAHALRNYEGPCENLHGHTWKIQLFLKGNRLNNIGLMLDFKTIRKELAGVVAELDHKLLNDLKPFTVKNPTSENIAEYLFRSLKKKFRAVSKVIVWESATTYAAFY